MSATDPPGDHRAHDHLADDRPAAEAPIDPAAGRPSTDPSSERTSRHGASTTDARASKIVKLLAQAEATNHPAEAETFLARAADLMARWQIDDVLLARARKGTTAADPVIEKSIEVGTGHYVRLRVALLACVSEHHCCRTLTAAAWNGTVATVVGHRADVDRAVSLYGALAIHSARAMMADSPRTGSGGATIRWRRSFLASYLNRIDARLRELSDRAQRDAAEAQSTPVATVALAIRDRTDAADDWISSRYGRLRKARQPSPVQHSAHAAGAGRSAADRAPLNDSIGGRPRGQIGAAGA
ncbi:MAG TPA: DUF2786 domain-containing protein [Acidimicrobiales bacterium]|nr:DUF2786 domain-containing protein [Acidimicrobiales bacterium]